MKIASAAMIAASMGLLIACDTQAPASAPDETTITLDGKEMTVDTPATDAPTEAPVPLDPETPAAEATLVNPTRVPANDVAEDRALLTAIPARFLGQWDAVDGPCAPESDMFLTIRPGTITFYESQGEVSEVRRGNPGIVVSLAMTGEGESWTSEYAMSLAKGGEQLATRAISDSGTGTMRRRCPVPASAQGS